MDQRNPNETSGMLIMDFDAYANFRKTGYIALTKNKDFVLVAVFQAGKNPDYSIAYLSEAIAVLKGNTIRKFTPLLQSEREFIQTCPIQIETGMM